MTAETGIDPRGRYKGLEIEWLWKKCGNNQRYLSNYGRDAIAQRDGENEIGKLS